MTTARKAEPQPADARYPVEAGPVDVADSEVLRKARERYEAGLMDLVSLDEAKAELGL